jgi:hypothetical protein
MLVTPEKRFLCAGDWHGNWTQAEKVLDFAIEQDIKVIVQLGDFGIWQDDKPFLTKLQKKLHNNDLWLYFIDGNHEDFDRLYAKPIREDGLRRVRDRIFHLPRGFRWNWGGISFLALGGAASIDKKFRREGRSWWRQELIDDEDVRLAIYDGIVDVMLTHDSPASAPNAIVDDAQGQMQAGSYFGWDAMEYCSDHRERLRDVTDILVPKIILHGHYHRYMRYDFTHMGFFEEPCTIIGLDEGSARLFEHTAIFDLEEAKTLISLDNKQTDDIIEK